VCNAHRPETDEILQRRERHKDAVEKGVGEKQQEELVVGETYTVVHPDNTASAATASLPRPFFCCVHQPNSDLQHWQADWPFPRLTDHILSAVSVCKNHQETFTAHST